jgi:hypothetical protein
MAWFKKSKAPAPEMTPRQIKTPKTPPPEGTNFHGRPPGMEPFGIDVPVRHSAWERHNGQPTTSYVFPHGRPRSWMGRWW